MASSTMIFRQEQGNPFMQCIFLLSALSLRIWHSSRLIDFQPRLFNKELLSKEHSCSAKKCKEFVILKKGP